MAEKVGNRVVDQGPVKPRSLRRPVVPKTAVELEYEKLSEQHRKAPLTGADRARLDQLKVEVKSLRFRRLANRRVPKVLKLLDQVARLGNKGNYAYTAEQADKLLTLIDDGFTRVKTAFVSGLETTQQVIEF